MYSKKLKRLTLLLLTVVMSLCMASTAFAGKKRRAASAKNKAAASKFCSNYKSENPGASCIVDKRTCPRGYVAERKWKGKGTNYSACVKGKKRERRGKKRAQGQAEAKKWCADYTAQSGESCRYVKTAHRCPKGFRRYTRIKNRNIRNYKICVKGKKTLKKKQVVPNNTNSSDAAITTRALNWLGENFDDQTNDFVIKGKKGKTRRTKRRLSRKFKKIRVQWHRKNDQGCKKEGTHGYRRSGQTRRVHICQQRIFPSGTSAASEAQFCSFVGTLFHEIAHAARVPKSKIHNDFDNEDRKKDHVYQLGIKAREACRADHGL